MILPTLKALFVHIPKTGGTSVKEAFASVVPCITPQWHMTVKDFASCLSAEEIRDFYKFAFVRNPWDRAVSAYEFRKYIKLIPNVSFEEWAINYSHQEIGSQLSLLDGVDFVGRYETFAQDMAVVADHLGVKLSLPHSNKISHPHYIKYYNKSELIKIIQKWSGDDCDHFGYEFCKFKLL